MTILKSDETWKCPADGLSCVKVDKCVPAKCCAYYSGEHRAPFVAKKTDYSLFEQIALKKETHEE